MTYSYIFEGVHISYGVAYSKAYKYIWSYTVYCLTTKFASYGCNDSTFSLPIAITVPHLGVSADSRSDTSSLFYPNFKSIYLTVWNSLE